jgi:hypothetical protein
MEFEGPVRDQSVGHVCHSERDEACCISSGSMAPGDTETGLPKLRGDTRIFSWGNTDGESMARSSLTWPFGPPIGLVKDVLWENRTLSLEASQRGASAYIMRSCTNPILPHLCALKVARRLHSHAAWMAKLPCPGRGVP